LRELGDQLKFSVLDDYGSWHNQTYQ